MSYQLSHKYVNDDNYKFIIISNVAVLENCNSCLFFPNAMLEDRTGDSSFTVFFRNLLYLPYLDLKVATDFF
jgi:hypothetical protein